MNTAWVGAPEFDAKLEDILSMCYDHDDPEDLEQIIEWENDRRPADMCPSLTGYCYALVNESMPGLVKIGMTKKDPAIRARQLSQQTAAPTPFKLAYFQRYLDNRDAEQFMHRKLADCRVSNKEFFRVDISMLPKLFHWATCWRPE